MGGQGLGLPHRQRYFVKQDCPHRQRLQHGVTALPQGASKGMGIIITGAAPGVKQQHAVRLCQSCAGGMGTHQHRYAQLAVQPQQHLQKFFFRRRIQRRTRLVQQKHPRRAGHSCRQGQQLLFPTGQRGSGALHQRLQMEECGTLSHPPRYGSTVQPGMLR